MNVSRQGFERRNVSLTELKQLSGVADFFFFVVPQVVCPGAIDILNRTKEV